MSVPERLGADPAVLLAGGGEMGERTRAFDWSQTPLGPIAHWPRSLQIAVRIMLDSRYAMWLGWGEDFTFFYNDAYARMTLGPKHPWALGRSAREVWSEIWKDIGPRAESVLRTGKATWDEGLLLFLEREGFPEETYHTFSYSPVPDDRGGIGGMLCVVTEDTQRTIGERRLRTLRELAARTTEVVPSAREACGLATRVLGENPRDLPFFLVYLIDERSGAATLAGSSGLAPGCAAAAASIDLSAPATAADWPLGEVLRTGRALVVDDVVARFGALPCGAWPEPPQRAVVLPLLRSGQHQLAGFVVAGISPRLLLDDGYHGFLELLAGHIATALANAGAYEQERLRVQALAQLDSAKTAFFSNVSHEFRTPLTLMLGPVEDLLARAGCAEDAAQLELVNRNGLRLLRLVNSLLDFSRIEAGRVRANFQPTDLGGFTRELASVFQAACERAGLSLTIDCEPLAEAVFVDRGMWETIVLNLLSNAFKYTLQGGITVSLRQQGGLAQLRVSDTGTGIAAGELPRLFERFHRIENARGRTHEGSGIGLALVMELVKLHGGTVSAESEPGRGTTFTLGIPSGTAHLPPELVVHGEVAAAPGRGAAPYIEEALRWLPDRSEGGGVPEELPQGLADWPAPGHAAGPGLPRPHVLVADDNADMRGYVARILGSRFEVLAVADGEAALAAATARPPELVLTDVMMPRLDGFGLLSALRAQPSTREVPVILLSARAGEESRVEGMEAGADDYLVKPFSAKELLVRVTAHVQMARVRREAGEALRSSNARFEALFDAAPIGIYLVDAGLRIRQVNPRARPAFGDIPDLIGSDLADILHRHWPQPFADEVLGRFRHTLATGEPYVEPERIEERLDRKVLEYYEWQLDRITLPDGQHGVVCYFNDISRHVQARQELGLADRRKDEFLATLAHELRNPLAPLRNGLHVMKLADNRGEDVEQVRSVMDRQLNQMIRLIDDLLDVSRISRGKVELRRERVALATVLRNALDTSRPVIEQAGHRLIVEMPEDEIPLDGDSTRLSQVFANLLNNAAKFTDAGGEIRVLVERHGSAVTVSVRDNGVGIPADMLPHVFEMFTQVDRSLDKAQGGLGIGLTIVKRLVEMHGGSVEARSDGHGAGSTFVVRLPVADRSVPAPPEDGAAGTDGRVVRQRILVVDDNEDSATSLATMLRLTGHETRTAFDGVSALAKAAEFEPDVVLLDIGMPRLDGYETARRIRRQPWARNVLLLALTGWGQEEDRRRSDAAGFDHHLVKPVDLAVLAKLLADSGARAPGAQRRIR